MCARVVQHQRRRQPGQPGRDHLRTAAEAGEEVRLDEAGGDAHVGVEPVPVEPDRHVARRAAGEGQRAVVARVVVDDAVALDNRRAEHPHELLGGVGAMRAGGDRGW